MSLAVGLTGRDVEMVVMLARGHTTDRVARELRLSRHTVRERISALLGRFKCRNRTELVAYCYVHGFLAAGIWPPDRAAALFEDDARVEPGGGAAVVTDTRQGASHGSDRRDSWTGLWQYPVRTEVF